MSTKILYCNYMQNCVEKKLHSSAFFCFYFYLTSVADSGYLSVEAGCVGGYFLFLMRYFGALDSQLISASSSSAVRSSMLPLYSV